MTMNPKPTLVAALALGIVCTPVAAYECGGQRGRLLNAAFDNGRSRAGSVVHFAPALYIKEVSVADGVLHPLADGAGNLPEGEICKVDDRDAVKIGQYQGQLAALLSYGQCIVNLNHGIMKNNTLSGTKAADCVENAAFGK